MNATTRLRQARFPGILDYVKKHAGTFVHDNEIKAAVGCGNSALDAFRRIVKRDLPNNLVIQHSGKNYLYKFVHDEPTGAAPPPKQVGLLMTLSFGQKETVTGSLEDFKSLYEQLRPLFGDRT